MPIGVYEVNIDQATNDRAQLGEEQIKRNPNIVQQQTADSKTSLTSDIFKAGKSLVSYTNPFWGLYRTHKGEDISFGAAFKDRIFTSNLGYLSASLMGAMDDMSRAAYNTSSFVLGSQGDVWEGANQYTDQPAKWLSDKALSIPQIKVNTNDVWGATQLLGDVSRTFIPFMIPAVGLATGSITMASNAYTESIHSGMDKETAQSRAFLAGATGVGMGLVAPLTGKQIVRLLAGESGAITTAAGMGVFNVGLGITQRAADWQMVKQKYPEMADKMEVLSAKTVGLDIALWAMFAGYGYAKVRKTLIEAGVPVSEVTKTVRAAEEVIGADTAVQDAVFVRRQNKSINDDGPIDSPEAYAAHEAMINDAEARIENAEPMPMNVPETVPLKPVESVLPSKEGGRIVISGKPVKKPSVSPDSILSFTDSIGIGRDRIVVHDINNPMPDNILKAAEAEGGNPDSIEAWIGDDGILHVNADGVKNMDAVKDVIVFHEMTHAGQDKAVVEKATQAIETATGTYADAVRQLRDQISANRNYDMNTVEGRTKATREATAKIMEDVLGRKQVAEAAQDGYLSQLVTAFKEALRSLGLNVKYSEKDIFRLVGKMWKQGQERMGVKLSTEAIQPMSEQTPRYTQEQAIADTEATKALDQASSNVKNVDFSIRPDMDANTRINKLSELVGKDAQGNDILSAEELIQVVGTVETRYAHITKMMTQSTVDIIDEYKRMGLGPYMKETKEQLLAMTDAERMWALTKGELLKTLGDKKETIRRQKIQAEKLQEREADYDRMLAENPDRTLGSERLIDMLMGDPTGRGVVMPWKNKADGINHEYMATLASGIKEFESWLGLKMTAEQEVNLVKELFEPGSSNDQSMRKAAEQVRIVFDAMRERMNKAGADIGYIKGYMPQTWDGNKILRFGLNTGDILLGSVRKRKQADMIAESKIRWVDFMMERIDRQNARYIDETTGAYYDDVQMREFLSAAFDTMSSGGMNKGVASGSPKQSGLSTRLGYERQLFFKSPEAWIEANRVFGSQDALSSIVSHVERGSKDLALLEMFGPNPNRVMQELINKAYTVDANTSYNWQSKLNYVQALWMEIAGNRPTQNSFLANASANVRKGLVFTKLGSALISQIGDLPIYRAMAMNNGFGFMDQVMSLYKGFDPRKKTSRELADTFEFGVTAMQDSVMSRFMDSTNGNDIMSKLAQFTMRAGGMQLWADSMSTAAKTLISRGLYHMSKYEYKDLGADNKALLRRSGITPDEWNNSLRGNTHIAMTADGKELYAPHLIEDMGLREKVWGMVERESTFLALRPDESTQALIKGQAARGSAGFELKSSMALFRSFTAAMIQKVYPRMASMNPGTSRSAWVWQNGSTYLFSILAGALAAQLKDVAKGQEPKSMDDWRFWGKASLQALNLGVIGDLAYGDYNRFGQSATTTVAGPVAGIIDDTLKLTQGNLAQLAKGEETHFAAEAIKYAKSYTTPNLWYIKPWMDQWLWYPLQELSSPGYLQRHQDRIEREQGTKFWLPPTGAARW